VGSSAQKLYGLEESLVVSIANRKGGTGKTTTTVNLAAEFASRGFRVLVIDMDTQGHSALGLGVSAPAGAASVHRLFQDPTFELSQALLPTQLERVSLIPADQEYDAIAADQRPNLLAEQLRQEGLLERFDMILIDTPPSLDSILINAMQASHGVLVPLLPHFLSAEGVRQLIRLFFKVATGGNPRLKLFGLVPVMFDRRVRLHKEVLEDMRVQFGAQRVLRPIRADIRLAEAFASSKPVRDYAPKSRGAMDYHLLTEELLSFWSKTPMPSR